MIICCRYKFKFKNQKMNTHPNYADADVTTQLMQQHLAIEA